MRFLFALLMLAIAGVVADVSLTCNNAGVCQYVDPNTGNLAVCDEAPDTNPPLCSTVFGWSSDSGLSAGKKMNSKGVQSITLQSGAIYVQVAAAGVAALGYDLVGLGPSAYVAGDSYSFWGSEVSQTEIGSIITAAEVLLYGPTGSNILAGATVWTQALYLLTLNPIGLGAGADGETIVTYTTTTKTWASTASLNGPGIYLEPVLQAGQTPDDYPLFSGVAAQTGGWPYDAATGAAYTYVVVSGTGNYLANANAVVATASATAPPSSTNGDPQFSGLQGQNFQFHGMADEVFSLVSSPELQVNSLFKFIASGKCDYNNTVCWSHPGTYLGQIAFQFGATKILLQSGSHSAGMVVIVNDKQILASSHVHTYRRGNSTLSLAFTTNGEAVISTHQFFFRIVNSDYFFNMDFGLHNDAMLNAGAQAFQITGELCERESRTVIKSQTSKIAQQLAAVYPAFPLHGLLGQTWRNVMYCGRYFEGTVDDYVTGGLFSNDHTFNFYQSQ